MTTLATSPSMHSSMTAPAASGKKFWTGALWLLWAACLGLGAIGIYQRIAYGHMPAGYGSYVPWGLWIAIYFHGVGIAGGAFAVAALGYILNLPGFRHPAALRAAIVLAFAAIIPALMAVWLDLGHMERASNILTSPSFTSMMAFNAWMYNAFLLLAALCWFISYRKDSGWLKPLFGAKGKAADALRNAVLASSESYGHDTRVVWRVLPELPSVTLADLSRWVLEVGALMGGGFHVPEQKLAEIVGDQPRSMDHVLPRLEQLIPHA